MNKIIAVALVLALLCACAQQGQSAAESIPNIPIEPQQPVQLRVCTVMDAQEGMYQALERVLEEYNSFNEGQVQVVLESVEGDDTLTALLREDPALYLLPADELQALAPEQFFADLTQELMPDRIRYYPSALARCTVEDRLYGVPFAGYTQAVVCSQSLFEEAGLPTDKTPQTWERLKECCEAVKWSTDAAGISLVTRASDELTDMALQFIHQAGGALLEEEDGTVSLQLRAEQVGKGLEFYRTLCQSYGTTSVYDNTAQRAFEEFYYGSTAITYVTPAQLALLEDRGMQVTTGRLPQGEDGPQAQLCCWALALSAQADAEVRQAAVTLIRYLTTLTVYEQLMQIQLERFDPEGEGELLLPLRTDHDQLEFFIEHPEYQPFVEGAGRVLEEPRILRWEQLDTGVLRPGLAAYLRGDLTLEELAAQVEEQSQAFLRP